MQETPLPGGIAAKIGQHYEELCAVDELLRMLHGETETLLIEPRGIDKVDFVVAKGGRKEFHQVKRGHPNGKWSIAALRSGGLLEAMAKLLRGNDDRFVFVSGSDARDLSELCGAARDAESIQAFERDFLGTVKRRKSFEFLIGCWKCDRPTAVDILQRIDIRTIDEGNLRHKVLRAVPAFFLADPGEVLSELQEIARNSVGHPITRRDLVEKLDNRGHPLRFAGSPEHAAPAIEAATDRYLEGVRGRLIQQTLVPRTAADTLLSQLNGTAPDGIMTGSAGTGKTACVIELVDGLRQREQPVLAFRLDRLPSLYTTADLGSHLNLQESPVLVLAAAAKAAGQPGVLIIDQLDAVSTMSGRSSEVFELVERLIQEARGMRPRTTIHTVVVCRAFDWKNDSGLRGLLPKKHVRVDVTEFEIDGVRELLTQAGFDPASFERHQLKLLRLPQNLALFLEAGFDPVRAPAFRTAKKLFDEYWKNKRTVVAETTGAGQWMSVIETLCDEMNATQRLSVPREKFDRISPVYLHSLCSEGVLTFDGHRYGFGHESFFDYCFARLFMTRSESLTDFLKRSEQHLFLRAQVRQVLAYLREENFPRYEKELEDLLSDENIRTHVKDLAFAILADVTDPTDKEWAIWERWTAATLETIENGTKPDGISGVAWRHFFGSESWFSVADRRSIIKGWLASENDHLADLAVNYLWAHQRHAPDRVAELLRPYADDEGKWTDRFHSLMVTTQHHTCRVYFNLLLQLVDNGTLDNMSLPGTPGDSFWPMLNSLGKNRPDWFAEVVAHRLRRRFKTVRATHNNLLRSELIGYDEIAAGMLQNSAEHSPAKFVKHMLPVVLEISDSSLIEDHPFKRDAVWQTLSESNPSGVEHVCLSALAAALKKLANEDGDTALEYIRELCPRDTYVANYLLQSVYSGAAESHADEAVSILSDQPWRFQCGVDSNPRSCTMELIGAVIPHCTAQNRERLEAVILDYVGPFESPSSQDRYNAIGLTSHHLLSAIPRALRSPRANRVFDELARRFGTLYAETQIIESGFVSSPIGDTAAARMTDDQWLSAIKKYSEEWPLFDGYRFTGGALELSRELGKRTKEDPYRFARLSLKFPADTNSVYLESVLQALQDASIEVEVKLHVCRKALADSRQQCGKSIADVLGRIDDPLPQDAAAMLHQLATKHEDPEKELWQKDYLNGDIYANGINTTRGRAAQAIHRLILADATNIARFRATLDRLVVDPSTAVRSCVAGALGAVAYHNPELGMRLFQRMKLDEDRLLATVHVKGFVSRNLHNDFLTLRPLIERMLRSTEPEVCEAGARFASIAAILHEGAADLGDEALCGNPRQRLGTAQVAARNVGVREFRDWCEERLLFLFNDDDGKVRQETASCFGRLPAETLESYEGLVEAFCDSKAFANGAFQLLHALEESSGHLPGMTCLACERVLDDGTSTVIYLVPKLAFRTYQQYQNDPEWTSRTLDLIDRLCLRIYADVGSEFEQFDR